MKAAARAARGAATTAAVMLAAFVPGSVLRAADITEAEAQAIGLDAYLYFYPLVTMDVTRRQLTNVEAGKSEIGGPPNMFVNVQAFPAADMRAVVRPNFDTLYSSAWLDMTKEPMVVSAPDTGGRYYLLPMLDMWTDVFASPGWRTTGTAAATYLVTPPGWRPDLRDRAIEEFKLPADTRRIEAPTPYVWIIGRTKTDGPADYDAVHKVQDGYRITPLSQWGKPASIPTVTVDPSVDMKTPPKVQVDTMPADRYFAYAAELMKLQPPHITDEPIIARMKRIGLEPGKPFDVGAVAPTVASGLQGVPAAAQKLMQWKIPTLARVVNGWSMNTDTMGVYGNYYLKRAMVAQEGLGANLPEDAIYPINLADATGKPLDGTSNYTLHFSKDDLPPVDAFWSVTLYDHEGFQVANELNRFAVSSWMPFKLNADGSLDLYFQNASPGADKEAYRGSARLAGLAGGVARVALGLALRFQSQHLVGFTDLTGFAFRTRGDLVRRLLRGLTLLLDAACLGTLGGAHFALGGGGGARGSQLGDGRILGLGAEAVQSSLLGRRGIPQTVAESWVSKGLHFTPINRFRYTKHGADDHGRTRRQGRSAPRYDVGEALIVRPAMPGRSGYIVRPNRWVGNRAYCHLPQARDG